MPHENDLPAGVFVDLLASLCDLSASLSAELRAATAIRPLEVTREWADEVRSATDHTEAVMDLLRGCETVSPERTIEILDHLGRAGQIIVRVTGELKAERLKNPEA